jgi:hypothetical protein
MAQISRPFQVAFVVLILFVGVWLFALRGHSSSTSGGGSAAPANSSPSGGSAAPGSVYHGSAPGVEGLSKAIAKAHGAVTTSQQNAKELQEKSAQASSSSSKPAGSSTASAPAAAATHTPGAAATHNHSAASTAPRPSAPSSTRTRPTQTGATRTPVRQAQVEQALKQGKIALVLFWTRKGADDQAVQRELRQLGGTHAKTLATFQARPEEVASFGSITRGVQVSQTPTLLIINRLGQATTVTGYTDAYAIEQKIAEARAS